MTSAITLVNGHPYKTNGRHLLKLVHLQKIRLEQHKKAKRVREGKIASSFRLAETVCVLGELRKRAAGQ